MLKESNSFCRRPSQVFSTPLFSQHVADFIDNIGSWLSYVATLELVQSFSGGSGLALSAVILIRFFPSLLLSPLAGVLADRCNRVLVLVTAAVADSVIVGALVAVRDPSQTPLLFLLLTFQFTAIALQDPARRAILPVLVPQEDLHMATTLETFSWSLTGALGAAVGGTIASKLGNSACFLIDAGTYLLAAYFASKVPRALGDPHAMERNELRKAASRGTSSSDNESIKEREGLLSLRSNSGSASGQNSGSKELELVDSPTPPGHLPAMPHLHEIEHRKHHHHQPSHGTAVIHSTTATTGAGVGLSIGDGLLKTNHGSGNSTSDHVKLDDVPLISPRGGNKNKNKTSNLNSNQPSHIAGAPTRLHSAGSGNSTAPPPLLQGTSSSSSPAKSEGIFQDALAACLSGWSAFIEGWKFLLARENRDVAVLVTMKGCGSFSWGAVDVLNVKFSELPSMQIEDGATTLGIIFATVGLGCFLGPVVMNIIVSPKPRQLLWASAASFGFIFAGAVLMATAKHLSMVLAASFIRSIGSAGMWIYSTLLLQLRCPNAILGRVSAAEMALYTVAEAASSLYGGAAFDVFGLTLEQTSASLAVAAGGVFGGWVVYAWWHNNKIDAFRNKRSSDVVEVWGSGDEEEGVPLQHGGTSY